jgi:methylated-DNA-[protein]-cysteine S-methyltransferase
MNRQGQYCIFTTAWGYFGFYAQAGSISRTCLPCEDATTVEQALLEGRSGDYDSGLMPQVQELVRAYFVGTPVAFHGIPLSNHGMSPFRRTVYAELCKVSPGNTVSYVELGKMAGKANAARAVGRAMATNPVPLIVPCHRVVSTSGQLCGFSAPGGVATKKRLLEHEKVVYGEISA